MTGQELKRARIQLGYTQAKLAEAVDMSPNTIARYEMPSNGRRYPIPNWLSLIMGLWLARTVGPIQIKKKSRRTK